MSTSMNSVNKMSRALEQFDNFDRVTRASEDVINILKNIKMVKAFGNVATEHKLSAPVVATMRAVPGFIEAAKAFPEASLFSVVPEHKSSLNQIQGLEALETVQTENTNGLAEKASKIADAIERVVSELDEVADIYKDKLISDKVRIEVIELPDDVFAHIAVYCMSEEGFSKILGMLDHHLREITDFSFEEIKTNPSSIREEIDALSDIVKDLGEALGISVDEYGVYDKNKSDEYTPVASTFGERGITKGSLLNYISRAIELCDVLKSISQNKDTLISSLHKAALEVPTTFESDEYTYGANEHFLLFTCYAKLTSKLIREAIVLIARINTAAASVLDLEEKMVTSDNSTVAAGSY